MTVILTPADLAGPRPGRWAAYAYKLGDGLWEVSVEDARGYCRVNGRRALTLPAALARVRLAVESFPDWTERDRAAALDALRHYIETGGSD